MQSIEKIIDTTPVSFAKDEVEAGYDDTQVERFDEPQELLTEKQGEHITIAIGTISEKQAGCTQTALEMAVLLTKSKQSGNLRKLHQLSWYRISTKRLSGERPDTVSVVGL